MLIKINKKNTNQKGISLVIALTMMTFLLSVSFSISNIILRQLRLTNINTSSQISFYAADSALECALYWDVVTDGTVGAGSGQDFSTAIFGTSTSYTPPTNPIKCGPNWANPLSFAKTIAPISQDIATTTFYLDYSQNRQEVCAYVEIVKTPYRTKISTSGYNTGIDTLTGKCDLTNAIGKRIVERGLVYTH